MFNPCWNKLITPVRPVIRAGISHYSLAEESMLRFGKKFMVKIQRSNALKNRTHDSRLTPHDLYSFQDL